MEGEAVVGVLGAVVVGMEGEAVVGVLGAVVVGMEGEAVVGRYRRCRGHSALSPSSTAS
jgi:hypothetical protein